MFPGQTKWVVHASLLALLSVTTPVRAIETSIQPQSCPDRDELDRAQGGSAAGDARAEDEEQTCGGGGGGSDSPYAYPGVRLPAIGGAAAGGAGGGGARSRTAAAQSASPQGSGQTRPAAQASDSTGNVAEPASRTGTAPSSRTAAGAPPPQAFDSTGNITYPVAAAGRPDDGIFGNTSASVGHVAPLPDLKGPLAWFVALIAGAFFWRRRARV